MNIWNEPLAVHIIRTFCDKSIPQSIASDLLIFLLYFSKYQGSRYFGLELPTALKQIPFGRLHRYPFLQHMPLEFVAAAMS